MRNKYRFRKRGYVVKIELDPGLPGYVTVSLYERRRLPVIGIPYRVEVYREQYAEAVYDCNYLFIADAAINQYEEEKKREQKLEDTRAHHLGRLEAFIRTQKAKMKREG